MRKRFFWIAAVALATTATACGDDDDGDALDAVDAAETLDEGGAGDTGTEAEATAEDGNGDAATEVGPEAGGGDPPVCEGGSGSVTRRRWADPLTGFIYCEAPCHLCEAVCLYDGTRSEGWYATCPDPGVDVGCGEAENLIAWANCM